MKKINWKLISDIAIIVSMTAVLIGYTFLAIEIKQIKQDIKEIKVIHEIKDTLFDEYDVDPKIKVE